VVKPWCSVKVERQVYGWFVGWCKKHGVLRQAQATKVLREWLEKKREEERETDNV
jgi:beta-lactamase class D